MNDLTISNITITCDSFNRYRLNDLHKAAGGETKHTPSKWVRSQEAMDLVKELKQGEVRNQKWTLEQNQPLTGKNGGQNKGIYACKELVYSYAMWISPRFHLEVIRAYDAMVQGKQPQHALPFAAVKDDFEAVLRIASLFGITGNQELLSANKAIANRYGINVMQAIEAPSLLSAKQEKGFIPTELGKQVGLSAIEINKLLKAAGLQNPGVNASGDKVWVLTEKGLDFGFYIDTGKRHGDGTYVQQIKWYGSVLELIIPTAA